MNLSKVEEDEESAVSMLIFTGIIALIFALVYLALSRIFLRLATTNRGTKKSVYKAQILKITSIQSALLRKELRRFTGSANYMLNCGLGIILMPICAVMLQVITLLFVVLLAILGLVLNLKMPNPDWTNEVVPIKQSLPTTIALFAG